MDIQERTVTDLLVEKVANNRDKIAINWINENNEISEKVTYGELETRAQQLGWYLKEKLNLQSQEPVILCYPPALINFCASYFGVAFAGGIAVPIAPINIQNPQKDATRVSLIIKDCDARYLITNRFYAGYLKPLIPTFRDSVLSGVKILIDEEIIAEAKSVSKEVLGKYPIKMTPESILMLQYTSGSTGHPKGVMLSHKNIINQALLGEAIGDVRTARILNFLPQYHDFGCIGVGIAPLFHQNSVEIYGSSVIEFIKNPASILTQISKFKITLVGSPPFMPLLAFRKLTPDVAKTLNLSSLEVWVLGAETLTFKNFEKLVKNYKTLGLPSHIWSNGYGLAEHVFAMTLSGPRKEPLPHLCVNRKSLEKKEGGRVEIVAPTHEDAYRIVSAGKLAGSDMGVTIKVVVGGKKAVSEGHVGEIWVHSRCVALGYYRKPVETEAAFQNRLPNDNKNYLRTGDIGFVYKGNIFIFGRTKDIMIVRGRNISPQDVEQIAEDSTDQIRRGCVVSFSVNKGNREKIVVVAEVYQEQPNYFLQPWRIFYDYMYPQDFTQVFVAIQSAIQESLQVNVDEILLVKMRTVPKTTSGKIQHSNAKDMYNNGEWNTHTVAQWKRKETKEDSNNGVSELDQPVAAPEKKKEEVKEEPEVPITEADVVAIIKEYLQREYGAKEINLTDTISMYGLDSIKTLQMIRELENKIHRIITLTGLNTGYTIKKFSEHVVNFSKPISKTFAAQEELSEEDMERYCPFVLGVGSHLPPHWGPISEYTEFMEKYSGLSEEKIQRLRKIVKHSAIEKRHSVTKVSELPRILQMTTHDRNALYIEHGTKMCLEAARNAIDNWGGNPLDITHVISISTTGVLVPDLSFQVVKHLGLSPTVHRENILYMGCFGGLIGIRTAKQAAVDNPKNRVLFVCTEICSLHMQASDKDEYLVANTIFADGAAAMIVGLNPKENEKPHLQILRNQSLYLPGTEHYIAWTDSEHGWIVGLSPDVPNEIFSNIEPFMKRFVPDPKIWDNAIWAVHPGGAAIIKAIETRMNLKPEQTQFTWNVLRDCGNMSSASVVFILNQINEQLRAGKLAENDHCIVLAFGPGIMIEGSFMRVIHN